MRLPRSSFFFRKCDEFILYAEGIVVWLSILEIAYAGKTCVCNFGLQELAGGIFLRAVLEILVCLILPVRVVARCGSSGAYFVSRFTIELVLV